MIYLKSFTQRKYIHKMKQFIRIVAFFLFLSGISYNGLFAQHTNIGKSKSPIYLNTSYSFEERATDLVSRLTPEEKQTLLGNTMSPIPRLGINKYDVWGEALHGVVGRNDNAGMTATSFPNSIAVGSTWDPELIQKEASVIADEARGFNKNVSLHSPIGHLLLSQQEILDGDERPKATVKTHSLFPNWLLAL